MGKKVQDRQIRFEQVLFTADEKKNNLSGDETQMENSLEKLGKAFK